MQRLLGYLVVVLTAIVIPGCHDRPPATPTSPPIPSANSTPLPSQVIIAVIGCSQTSNAWRGWLDSGDDRVWQLSSGYGGGDVVDWANDIPHGDYWQRLEDNIAANPAANVIWWQLCDLARANGQFSHVDAIRAEIENRTPGAAVYVTPLADFEKPETCTKMDVANSNLLVDYLVSTGQARRGPDLPLVLDSWIQPPQGDGKCHVGREGKAMFGMTLAGFNWSAS